MKPIQIKIFHDTVCPWCRIGKANLLTALREMNKGPEDVDISYQTFFLHRDLPEEGVDYEKYLTSKLGGIPLHTINERPIKFGKEAGVKFNFDKITIIPNTILSNLLIYLTPPDKKQLMVDKLGELYFEQGVNIGDIKVLLKLATELGVNVTEEELYDKHNQQQVLNQDQYGKNLGITGVPFYIFNEKYAMTGAQPVSAFKNLIQRISGELETLL